MSLPGAAVERWLDLAIGDARCASADILAVFETASQRTELKADGSVVTQADRDAERRIREFLRDSAVPPYPVLGEELGDDTQGSPYRWVIDPIDGTFSYSRGLPNFGTLVAFEDALAGRALVGVIHLPVFAETYAAARGDGASCNGKAIRVAPERELADCIVSSSSLRDFQTAGLEEGYGRLSREVAHLRGNYDCWTHAMAARGAIDVVVEFGLHRWDIAATEVLIEEAGGTCLIRASRAAAGKYDSVFGNSRAVDEVARLVDF